MNNYIPELFELNDEIKWKTFLDENGYVVIKNILNSYEKENIFNTFKTNINTVSPLFDLDNQNTLTIENTPLMFGKGMAVFNGFGQSDFMWKLRLNKNIKNIYEKIHNTKDLCVSLDGFSLFVSGKQISKPWLHIDQNPKNNIYSIQGAYNFLPVNENDAGFILIPKSHILSQKIPDHNKDWIVFDNQEEYYKKSVKLIIPENCFILWNSKLIHSNKGISDKKYQQLNRLTAYIAFLPKNLRSTEILEKKIQAYKSNLSTSHWANKCEIKQYPWGFKKTFEKRGYNTLQSTLNIDGTIPAERLNLL